MGFSELLFDLDSVPQLELELELASFLLENIQRLIGNWESCAFVLQLRQRDVSISIIVDQLPTLKSLDSVRKR